MATFAVFMHTMLSAALDSSFLASIVQNEEGKIVYVFRCQVRPVQVIQISEAETLDYLGSECNV